MDARCLKFWEDGQALVAAATDASRAAQTRGKVLKELRTMSRFLQRNQASRFSDSAQQKLVDCVGQYVALAKPRRREAAAEGGADVLEAVFQVVKDGLAMPFNVMGSKQKKKLLKWYNELIGLVGGDPDALTVDGTEAEAVASVEWSVLGIDDDGYLSLMHLETGETSESFQVKSKSKQLKQIQQAIEDSEVTVVTTGGNITEIRVK